MPGGTSRDHDFCELVCGQDSACLDNIEQCLEKPFVVVPARLSSALGGLPSGDGRYQRLPKIFPLEAPCLGQRQREPEDITFPTIRKEQLSVETRWRVCFAKHGSRRIFLEARKHEFLLGRRCGNQR